MALKNWSLASVAANTLTDLISPTASKEIAIVGLIICNDESTNTAAVAVTLTSSGNTKGVVWKGSLVAGESVHIDTKLFIAASATPDKVRVLSDQANVSFIASGDES